MPGSQSIECSKFSKGFDLYQSMRASIEIYFAVQMGFVSAHDIVMARPLVEVRFSSLTRLCN